MSLYECAKEMFAGKFTKNSRKPASSYSEAVASMLESWGAEKTFPKILDVVAIAYGLLEGTCASREEIMKLSSKEVLDAAEELSNIDREFKPKKEHLAKLAKDSYKMALVTKCADRICSTKGFANEGELLKASVCLDDAREVFEELCSFHAKKSNEVALYGKIWLDFFELENEIKNELDSGEKI